MVEQSGSGGLVRRLDGEDVLARTERNLEANLEQLHVRLVVRSALLHQLEPAGDARW